MKYQDIIATTHNIASASTTQWGNEMQSIVKFIAIPVALVLTTLELVVDFFDRPLQTIGMLNPPVNPKAETIPVTPTPTPERIRVMEPVRHRITRKRGLAEIRSLTA